METYFQGLRMSCFWGKHPTISPELRAISDRSERALKMKPKREANAIRLGLVKPLVTSDGIRLFCKRKRGEYVGVNLPTARKPKAESPQVKDGIVKAEKVVKAIKLARYVMRIDGIKYPISVGALPAHAH